MATCVNFSEGEKVLCFHGPLLYAAKCMKSQVDDGVVKYFIHYNGWNKKWNEWVEESRILKYNDANIQKQKELELANRKTGKSRSARNTFRKEPEKDIAGTQEEGKSSKRNSTVASGPSETTAILSQKKKRSRMDPYGESAKVTYLAKLDVKIEIPKELKSWLVDDWDLVTRQKKLVQLPCRLSVDRILDDYVKQKTSAKDMTLNKVSTVIEVTNGIRKYFNVILGNQLLYRFERPQYAQVLSENPETEVSAIYGAVHLLRFFVRLGTMLSYSQLSEENVELLLIHIHDFIKYLSSNFTLFSHSDYIITPPEYCRRVV